MWVSQQGCIATAGRVPRRLRSVVEGTRLYLVVTGTNPLYTHVQTQQLARNSSDVYLRECPLDVTTEARGADPGLSASPSSPKRLRVREWNPAPRRAARPAGDSGPCVAAGAEQG